MRQAADVPTRVLLFTGKGGVGKTTVAAATAVRCADEGLRTLVLSTDPAHSLADAFDRPLGTDPVAVGPGLWAQQLDASERLEDLWGDIQTFLVDVFDWAGLRGVEAEELAVLPGLDEVFALADIKGFADSGCWDVVVVDCAPTAETLRLLSLPEVLSWYMQRVFPTARVVTQLVRPVVQRMSSMPIADDRVFGAVSRLYARLDGVRELLTDRGATSVRLVVNPEAMVIAEARRTATYLALFGYGLDLVIANRLLPDAIEDPWFKAWKEAHAEHLRTISEAFDPVPVVRAELAPEELVGIDRLRRFASSLYADGSPAAVHHDGDLLGFERRGAAHVLTIALPFADRDELDVGRSGDELLVRVGPHRRALLLPDSLRRRTVVGATLVGDRLEIRFEETADDE